MSRPLVLFCTAAGGTYGYGHLKRCMTLIDEGSSLYEGVLCIRMRGGTSPEYDGLSSRYTIVTSPEELDHADLILSDQRETSRRLMKSYVRRAPVVSLDDRGAGRRFAHTTIYSLPTIEGYRGNYNGPGYLILDRRIREASTGIDGSMISNEQTEVVVSFGGSDPHNLTGRVTEALNRIGVRPVVVRGPLFTHKNPDGDYRLVNKPDNMAEILTRGAFLITSFGITAFEARYLGVPVILLNHSPYHEKLARLMKNVTNLGFHRAVGEEELAEHLKSALQQEPHYYGDERLPDVDGRGVERVLAVIEKALHARRKGCFAGHGMYTALKRDNNSTLMVCRRCGDMFLFELEALGDIYGRGDYFLSEYEAQYGKSYIDDKKNISRMALQRLDVIEDCATRTRCLRSGESMKGSSVRSKKLLDVGCALGFFLDVARNRGWESTGVEVSEFAAEWARKHLGVTVINSSFLEFNFEPESYDVITFFFVAEHFKDVEKVIERAYAALKPGGFIACALPNGRGISSRIDRKTQVQDHPRDHYFDTCPRNLIRFLKTYGFRMCRVRVTGIHPERFFGKLGVGINVSVLNTLYGVVARILKLGDTFEYYGTKT